MTIYQDIAVAFLLGTLLITYARLLTQRSETRYQLSRIDDYCCWIRKYQKENHALADNNTLLHDQLIGEQRWHKDTLADAATLREQRDKMETFARNSQARVVLDFTAHDAAVLASKKASLGKSIG